MLRTRIKLLSAGRALVHRAIWHENPHITVVRNARKGAGIVTSNPQPRYASLSNLEREQWYFTRAFNVDMVLFQSHFLDTGKRQRQLLNGTVTVTLVNERGARISERYHVAEG